MSVIDLQPNRLDRRNETLFGYIFLAILSFDAAITFTELQPQGIMARVLLVAEIISFFIYLIQNQYTIKSLTVISIIVLFGIIVYLKSGYTAYFKAIISTIVFQKINSEQGFKYLFVTRLAFMLIINILAIIGVLNLGLIIVGKSYGNVLGYGLGYNHPNRYAYTLIYLEMALICWKNERIRKRDYVIIFMLGVGGYFITKTRTLIGITVLLMLLIIGYKNEYLNKMVKWLIDKIGRVIYPLCFLLSLVIPYLIKNSSGVLGVLLNQLNLFVSGRFGIISGVFEFYDVTAFGGVNEFSLLSQKYNYTTIDNGYIRILFQFGLLGTLIYLVTFVFLVHKLLLRDKYIYVICTIVVAVWGLSENILIDSCFNITILFVGMLYSERIDGDMNQTSVKILKDFIKNNYSISRKRSYQ